MSGKLQQGGFLQQLLQQFSQTEVKKLQQLQQQQQQQQQGGVKNKKSKSAKKKRGGGDEARTEAEKEEQAVMERAQQARQKSWDEKINYGQLPGVPEARQASMEETDSQPPGQPLGTQNAVGTQFAGNVKVYTGPKEGKFIINKHGKKVYIDRKTLNNNVPYLKKKAKAKKAVKK